VYLTFWASKGYAMCDRPANEADEKKRAIELWADLAADIVDRAEPESQPRMLHEDVCVLIERHVRAYLRTSLDL